MLSSESTDDWLMVVDDADDHEVSITNSDSRPARPSDYLLLSYRSRILFSTRSSKLGGICSLSRRVRFAFTGDSSISRGSGTR